MPGVQKVGSYLSSGVVRYGSLTPLSIDISDLDLVDRLSDGRVDLTYGR